MNPELRDPSDLAVLDDRRLQASHRATAVITLGVVFALGSWLMLPVGLIQLASVDRSPGAGLLVVGGLLALAVGVALFVVGRRQRRAIAAERSPRSAHGKANPAFDEDRRSVPTGGQPASWAGFSPPGL